MAEVVRRVRALCLLLLFAGLLGCDHATKLAASEALGAGKVVTLASGVLDLRYTENRDTAFSLFRWLDVRPSPAWLLAASGVALVFVAIAWLRAARSSRRATPLEHAGYAMIVAGALGNVIDRAVRGFVIDFIHVAHWPVFNVADIAVVLGVLLLALARARSPAVG